MITLPALAREPTERSFAVLVTGQAGVSETKQSVKWTPPFNPSIWKTEFRNSEILLEAAKLFAAKGYDGTSIRDIARAVGVAQASLYHFFADKREIHSTVRLSIGGAPVVFSFAKNLKTLRDGRRPRRGVRAGARTAHFRENAPFYFAAALGYSVELTDPVVKCPGSADARYL